ncbi:hypothetical protein ACJJTC_007133 [Scirpophaga incertulas]
MFNTPPSKIMVKTRSATSKAQESKQSEKSLIENKINETLVPTTSAAISVDGNKVPPGSVVKSEQLVCKNPSSHTSHRSAMSKKLSSATSIQTQKKKLELEAAKAKARIQMELIDKQLAADIAELNDEYSPPSEASENHCAGSDIERWVERSQKELELQHATMVVDSKGKPQTSDPNDTNGPVQQPSQIRLIVGLLNWGAKGDRSAALTVLVDPSDIMTHSELTLAP